jgi:hypothetical protein
MFGGVSPELSTALKAQPEVAGRGASTVHPGPGGRQLGGGDRVVGRARRRCSTWVAPAGSAPTLGADGVALGTSYAKDHGLSLGDSVTITTASGASRSLTVRQLFRHTDWAGRVVVDRATFAALQPGALDTSVYVKGADGVSAEALRAAVERWLRRTRTRRCAT